MKVIIIGASAAGLKAACRAKRLMPAAEISVFDKSEYISYGACGLPYYLSGDIGDVEALMRTPFGVKRTPDFFLNAKGVEIRSPVLVERIKRGERKLVTKDLKAGERSEVPYDKLVVTTGAIPIKPEIHGIDNEKICFFKNIEDALKLRGLLEKGEIEKVGIVGGGFIGLELAEAFSSMWGCEVTLFEACDQLLPRFLDPEMSLILEDYLKNEGVEIVKGNEVLSFDEVGDKIAVNTGRGERVLVDRVVVNVGVVPNSKLAEDAGLNIGPSAGIVVDDSLLTSDPNIYAAGDCVENVNSLTGERMHIPLGSLANRQGWVIGSNLAGLDEKFKPVTCAFAVKVFDYNVAVSGITERAAKKANLKVAAQWGTMTDCVEYYPDVKNIHLKLIFEPETRNVLGFQSLGPGETVKRADVITSLIRNGGTLGDILDLEFAYAPPYAPPLDPLFALATLSLNCLDHGIEGINPGADIKEEFNLVVDVRMKDEAQKSPIDHPEILNIPFTEFRSRIGEIPKDKSILVVCAKGSRSAECVGYMLKSGFNNVKYLGGGLLSSPNV